MTVPKASFQPFVDWCTQPQAGIFVPDLQAVLTLRWEANPEELFTEYFYGTLGYSIPPPSPFQPNPPAFWGILRSGLLGLDKFVEINLGAEVGEIDDPNDLQIEVADPSLRSIYAALDLS